MRRFSTWLRDPALAFAARINIYAIGLATLWTPIDSVLIQLRVGDVVSGSFKDTVLGLITFVGITLGALTQPIAGRMSDRASFPDRRRLPMAVSTALVLVLLFFFWRAPGIYTIFAAYLLLQLAANTGQAAYQALIPDLVAPANRGLASGVKNVFQLLGAGLGLASIGLLSVAGGIAVVLLFIGIVLAVTTALNVLWTPSIPPPPPERRARGFLDLISLRSALGSYRIDLGIHRNFGLTIATRFLFYLGLYPIQRFLLYYLEDRFQFQAAFSVALFVLGVLAVAVLGAATAGPISDRFDRKLILQLSIVLAAVGVVGLALAPTLLILVAVGAALGLGLGAFEAVNWALVADFIPEAGGGRFFGLANLANSVASSMAGLFGLLITAAAGWTPGYQYEIAFLVAAFITLTSLIPLRLVPAGRRPQPPPGG